jgi:hypothetical protein
MMGIGIPQDAFHNTLSLNNTEVSGECQRIPIVPDRKIFNQIGAIS